MRIVAEKFLISINVDVAAFEEMDINGCNTEHATYMESRM